MRYDESVSFLIFVKETISRAFYYPVPNNHVLNTLLEKLSCAVVGTSPVAIRLPAFIAGVAHSAIQLCIRSRIWFTWPA